MVSALRACMGHGSERKLHCRPRKRGLLEVYIYIYIYIYMYIYRYRWEVCISIFPQYSARYIEVEIYIELGKKNKETSLSSSVVSFFFLSQYI